MGPTRIKIGVSQFAMRQPRGIVSFPDSKNQDERGRCARPFRTACPYPCLRIELGSTYEYDGRGGVSVPPSCYILRRFVSGLRSSLCMHSCHDQSRGPGSVAIRRFSPSRSRLGCWPEMIDETPSFRPLPTKVEDEPCLCDCPEPYFVTEQTVTLRRRRADGGYPICRVTRLVLCVGLFVESRANTISRSRC